MGRDEVGQRPKMRGRPDEQRLVPIAAKVGRSERAESIRFIATGILRCQDLLLSLHRYCCHSLSSLAVKLSFLILTPVK
jgi:hypothetical protein